MEYKLGLYLTTLLGVCVVIVSTIFFINLQNIWLCYTLTLILSLGQGIAGSLTGKNVLLYKPDKKALLTSIFISLLILLSSGYSYLIEKLLNPDGYTLKEDERYYPHKICSKVYLDFSICLFAVPIGAFTFAFFTIEYKKKSKELNKNEDIEGGIINEGNEEENEENDNGKGEELNSINIKEQSEDKNPTDKESESKKVKEHIKISLKTIRFWRQCTFGMVLNFSMGFIGTTFRIFGADIGIDGKALQNLILVIPPVQLV